MKFTCKRGETTNTFFSCVAYIYQKFPHGGGIKMDRTNKKNCLTFCSFIWAFWEKMVAK